MRVLVTGATGFVGRHLVADLLQHNHDALLTDQSYCASDPIFHRPVLKLDITNYDDCLDVISTSKPDAIIHLAGIAQSVGQTADSLNRVNVDGTKNLALATAAYLKLNSNISISFLFVSSAFVVGGNQTEGTHYVNEHFPTIPRGPYGASKLSAEQALSNIKANNLDIFIARPFNHIGAGQHHSFVVPGICGRMQKAAPDSTIETGNMDAWRDFTDVRDVVRAYRLIIEKRPQSKLFVIGSGRAVTIQTVFDKLNQITGKNLKQKLSEDLRRNEGTVSLIADISLAQKELDWRPEITLDESLKAAWNEYK